MRFIEKKVDIPAKERKKIESAIINLQVMPSMRALWAAGPAAEKTNASVFNCAYNNITSIKSFSATMYLLMCGCGVGFSVENHFIARLPELKKKNANKTHVVVEDSREGWARAFYKLLIAHFEGHDVTYDLSKLRPAGARLKTFGGKSSGPGPLKDLFDFVGKVFNEARRVNRKRLSSLDCLDILNKAGECVTAGGIRRSAQISLSDLDDSLIAGAKQGQFWLNNGHRALSNNSAVYHGRPDIMRFLHEFTELIKSGAGERGIFNRTGVLANIPDRRIRMDDMGTNPCQPPNTLVYTRDGDITIKELASKCRNGGSVEVWDGNKWVACNNFRETGYHQDVYTVTLYDGTVIEATGYHKFLLEDGTRLKLLDLKLGDRLARSYAPGTRVPNDNRIKSLAFSRNEPIVYCCTIPSTNSFALSCGIQIGQCSEITLRDKEFCNLSSNVIRANDSLEDVLQKVRVATHIGTIQAMFTDFPEDIMGKGWMKNCNEERLLGVSLTGLRDHPVLSSVNDEAEQWLKSMKYTAISEAEKWSKAYGINMPASITCVKPEGNSSQLNESASGCHPRYAAYYIRRYRVASTDSLYKMMLDQGVQFRPEIGQDPNNPYTWVVDFPVKSPDGAKTRHATSALEQLEYALFLKKNWAEHQVSCTVYVKENEWPDVMAYVYNNFDDICGISFLPEENVYQLAPYEEVTEAQYNKLASEFPALDYSKLVEYENEDETSGSREYACVGDKCELV